MSFLDIQNVQRHFGSQRAVDGVSIAVERGEFISLLGPSGSGKTTLLRIVAGFERPDSGAIVVDGENLTRTPPQRRNMGMVFQSYALFPNLTAADNVAFGLRTRHVPPTKIKPRVEELLTMVGLGEKAGRYPHQLSGGEQQRVALARALAPNPRVLLLDEPLSALDARIRVTLRAEIRRIQRTLHITTLYVTHDQEEALAMSDRVVVFNQGHAEQIGTPEDIYDRPATSFVSSFVGTTNRLVAQVADVRAGLCVIDGQKIQVNSLPDGIDQGSAVDLWLRPERIHLTNHKGPDDTNQLSGTVEDAMFLGARTGMRVTINGQPIMVDVPRDPGYPNPRVGELVTIYFSTNLTATLSNAQ
ncbi:MAG: ABC transporter ATP-binding protein [Sulfobacillus sp.]